MGDQRRENFPNSFEDPSYNNTRSSISFQSRNSLQSSKNKLWNPNKSSLLQDGNTFDEPDDVEKGSSTKKANCCCNARLCWWEPPKQSLPLDFCRDTSLHGLKYISQPQRHITERYQKL